MRALFALVAAGLVASALSLVTAQHRARSLFVDLERAQQEAKRLDVEADRLRIDLGRISQPAMVESAARQLGMQPIDGKRVAVLPSVLPGPDGVPPTAVADAAPAGVAPAARRPR
jgi:cell division protein FtsL